MKVETLIENSISISEYTEYRKEDLEELFRSLVSSIEAAEKSGFTDVYLTFRSTRDPYDDDSLGPVEVEVLGMREMTAYEKAKELEGKKVEELARKLGVTFYEAATLLKLRESGKLDDLLS